MRDPYRLYDFYEKLRNIHINNFPDLRFGQLCYNFFSWLNIERSVDYFFPEEEEMLLALERYIKSQPNKKNKQKPYK